MLGFGPLSSAPISDDAEVIPVTVSVTGLSATSALGSASTLITTFARAGHELTGWGEEGFGTTAWGGEKSTLSAMQGQVGTAVVREEISV